MPLTHRHAHPKRGLIDEIGDMIDNVKRSPQNGNGGGGGGSGGGDDDAAMPTAIEKPTNTNINMGTEIAKATGQARPETSEEPEPTSTQALSAPTQTSDESSSDDESGLGAGATAGIVFGVLGGILLIAGLIYFAFSLRKKGDSNPSNGEEKFVPVSGPPPPLPLKDTGLSATTSASKSPRLSLRPVTQFFPNMNTEKPSTSNGPSGVPPPAWRSPAPAPFERPNTSQSAHPSNPFGNQAERAASPVTEEHSMQTRSKPPTPNRDAKPLPAGGRQTSMHEAQPNMDFTLPDRGAPSPTGTVFSMSSMAPDSGPAPQTNGAAAIAAAGGPRNTAVHRVQLDFKPSLSDEMELKAGELVRLLHEYDDGWALCIRLDRSRQGVVPRTCLSTRPVKPRPQQGGPRGPPVNPQRPESPGGPMSPGSPGSPQSGVRSQSPMGRPMSPGGRSQSPAGRARAPSKTHGPSPMNPASRAAPSPGAPPPGMAM